MATFTFTNSTGLLIPPTGTSGATSQTLNVFDMQGAITDVSISLVGVSHTFPDDFDFLLVGPDGTSNLEFWSDAGGSTDLVNVDLTFSDSATSVLADGSPIAPGAYKPTGYGTGDPYVGFAGVVNKAGPSGGSTFGSAFDGRAPNGTWTLHAVDDVGGDIGELDSWSLAIETSSDTAVITGTAGADTLTITASGANSGAYSLNGGPVVSFTGLNSLFFSGLGDDDTLIINDPLSQLFPTGGVFFNGDPGNDIAEGSAGIDTLSGFSGGDLLLGRAGDDTLNGGADGDMIDGGSGIDRAIFSGPRAAYALTNLGAGNVQLLGPDGFDSVTAVERLVFADATLNWPLTNGNDFNGDAFGDILWRNVNNGQVQTWELDGAGAFALDSYGAAGLAWQQIAADDFNADGEADILWRNNTTGQVAVWELNGAGAFAFEGYGAANLAWQSVGAGDFNADGIGDVLYRNTSTGEVATWELNGSGGLAFDSYGTEDLAWKIVGIGDFNQDSIDDILWRNSTNGQVKTWELDGAGGFASDTYGAANLSWHIFGVGDFNADGHEDVLWRNDTTGATATWELNGAGGFAFDTYGAAASVWTIMHATDTNSDGKDDILWRNTSTGQVAVWELNGAGAFSFQGYGSNTLDWQIFDGNFQFV